MKKELLLPGPPQNNLEIYDSSGDFEVTIEKWAYDIRTSLYEGTYVIRLVEGSVEEEAKEYADIGWERVG